MPSSSAGGAGAEEGVAERTHGGRAREDGDAAGGLGIERIELGGFICTVEDNGAV